ncbi:GNAT family N-acetyltransferase [Saccharibacillus kuerlensis]|uniref:GNAT family acetyltransferase n=1 Tax=Saccharibacillus kuerlensis TaxID=459527 RepID=A0ABQ2KSM2_9BACL|nr:GNAT family N-acetyltransferase [Saccharibacillus kuerlensis]GGN91042.1 GNAT family acetyltransferase [Saccharibacillus kuerlensis]
MQIITCTEEHQDRLTEIWMMSIRRTLSDLDPGDIQFYARLFGEEILERLELYAVQSRFGGELTGFIAMNGSKVELLVVHPHYQGQGVAGMLLDHVAQRGELAVEVGDQAPAVYDFYHRFGFVETGRSEQNHSGRSGATVHLLRPQLEQHPGAS